MRTTHCDKFSLNHGDNFGAGFDRHVATCNHNAVGSFDDFFEMFVGGNGFFGFDFGNYLCGRAEGKKTLFQTHNIASGLNKGKGNVVVVAICAVFDVGNVFRG